MLCRWLASLPVQLYQLGHRIPALSAQIIASIQAAASRGHKEMLNSLQTNACMIYGTNSRYVIVHVSLMKYILNLIKQVMFSFYLSYQDYSDGCVKSQSFTHIYLS